MKKTEYNIPKMDCSSEEQMIRMKLEGIGEIQSLHFDLEARQLEVIHEGNSDPITASLKELDLGAELVQTTESVAENKANQEDDQRKALWIVLVINVSFFLIEMTAGFIAVSMGLLGDSLDMLADSIVYVLSLMAIGKALSYKKQVAKLSGWFQLGLAILGFGEVIRRFLGYTEIPVFEVMIIISAFALVGNTASLIVINRAKSDEAHMKASAIFTSNDIIVNLGVITAGVLVKFTSTAYPDLVIGAILFIVVARGAFRILKLAT
ncbi:MAG: cation transporter [Candidatus Marinimicrobia bacterium]|nr:cation transporter [Candidatus Neomarinimicrobiota bacterium]